MTWFWRIWPHECELVQETIGAHILRKHWDMAEILKPLFVNGSPALNLLLKPKCRRCGR